MAQDRLQREGNRIWCAGCDGIGGRLPLPLAGEGWGGWGLSLHGDRQKLWWMSPRGENPHPPRSASASASPASGRGGATPPSS
ncbi:hypothetical protein DCM78_14250 [Bradyrhizobium sp. WBOS04]|nr:hypothetical protein DCM78_14250 [Bradyrhizobium sp. WBOS04]